MNKRPAPRPFDKALFEAIEVGRISPTVTAEVAEWYYGVKAGRIELKGL